MKREFQDAISELLGVQPVEINSSLVSAQNRRRLYWSSLPITQPCDTGITLDDIVETDIGYGPAAVRGRRLTSGTIVGRRVKDNGVRADNDATIPISQCLEVRSANRDKSNCLTTVEKDNVLTPLPVGRYKDAFKNNLPFRYYTLKEYCRLQTVPDNHFDGILSDSAAKKILGNGWTIDVIAHILRSIP